MEGINVTSVKKRRKPNWSEEESIAMINGVQYRNEIFNDKSATNNRAKKIAWRQVTDEVNIVSESNREVFEVIKKYRDLRSIVKNKAIGKKTTGGKPAKRVTYSLVEEAMLQMIGSMIDGVDDMPDSEEVATHDYIDCTDESIVQQQKQQQQQSVSARTTTSPHSLDSTEEYNMHQELVSGRTNTLRPILPKPQSELDDSIGEYNPYKESVSARTTTSRPSPPQPQGRPRQYRLQKETHCSSILDQLLKDDTFTDVTLTAEGRSIRAHRVVLCLASTYFRDVLNHDQNIQSVVILRDIKFAELKNIIHFIYTGEATVDATELESFMKTAEILEITSLCEDQKRMNKGELNSKNYGSKFDIRKFDSSKGTKRNLKDASPLPSKNRKKLETGKYSKAISEDSPRIGSSTSFNREDIRVKEEGGVRHSKRKATKKSFTEFVTEETESEDEGSAGHSKSIDSKTSGTEFDREETESEDEEITRHSKVILGDSRINETKTLSQPNDRGETEEKNEGSQSGSDGKPETSGRTSPLVVLYLDGNKIELK